MVAVRLPAEVDSDARVLRFGTAFVGRVWDSEQPLDVHQRIIPGDATGARGIYVAPVGPDG